MNLVVVISLIIAVAFLVFSMFAIIIYKSKEQPLLPISQFDVHVKPPVVSAKQKYKNSTQFRTHMNRLGEF